MADKPQLVVNISPDAHAAQEIAAGLKALEEAGRGRNNNVTVPGGVYGNANGEGFHDAHGNPVTEDGKPIAEGDAADDEAESKPARGKKK